MTGRLIVYRDTVDALRLRAQQAEAEVVKQHASLNKPLRETILYILTTMPKDASPEHLAAAIERQVRSWQAIPVRDDE